jgi:hypothetical protein
MSLHDSRYRQGSSVNDVSINVTQNGHGRTAIVSSRAIIISDNDGSLLYHIIHMLCQSLPRHFPDNGFYLLSNQESSTYSLIKFVST